MRNIIAFLAAFAMAVCTLHGAGSQTNAPQAAARPSFSEWLAGVRAEAIARGVHAQTIDAAFAEVEEPEAIVIERDRSQAEIVLPLETYLAQRLTRKTIAAGREKLASYRAILDRVAERYGVPARLVVAIWGFESNYGRFTGVRPTITALATLAWDARRSALFRGELLDALAILDRGDVDVAHMRGSWAGAMGQPQFMPSSYLKYAQDFDGDGRRDIWSTPADVFASIANFLKGYGWRADQPWGREVELPRDAERRIARDVEHRDSTCHARRDMTVWLPAERWRQLGVRALANRPLPKSGPEAALVSGEKRHFLVYRNYDALLEYNCAHAYALGVALLGDRIAGGPLPPAHLKHRRRS